MSDEVSLGDRLREARFATATRRRSAVSQGLMAELVGKELRRVVHQGQWSLYEANKSEPPLDVIRAVSTLSGLAAQYLAFGASPNATLVNPDTGDDQEGLGPGRSVPLPRAPIKPRSTTKRSGQKKRGAR